MARTLEQIIQSIDDRKALEPALATLDSVSQTARWRLWRYVVAYALWLHEQVFDTLRADLQAIADAATPGSAGWYAAKVLAYQHTDVLTVVDGQLAYAVLDPTLQIVKRVSIEDTGTPGQILVKAAKGSAANPAPLASPVETDGLADYLSLIKFSGIDVQLRSVAADNVKPTMTVYYEPQRTESLVNTEVKAAMRAYLTNLDFNGRYRQANLIDAVQSVKGVVDVAAVSVDIEGPTGTTYNSPRTHLFYAGYATIAEGDFTITYTPAP